MHTTFDPESIDWSSFIQPIKSDDGALQFGEGVQGVCTFQYGLGGTVEDYAVFRGLPYQRGTGIGSIFRSLLRYILPLGRQAGRALGREGVDTSQRILQSVLKGNNVKDSIVSEGREGLKNLASSVVEKLSKQSGDGHGGGDGGVGKYKKNATLHKLPPIPKGRNLRTIIPPPTLNTTTSTSTTTPPITTTSLIQSKGKHKNKASKSSKARRIDSLGFY
jgi:hypothetical protein